MSDIEFESDNMNYIRRPGAVSTNFSGGKKGMSAWLISHGFAGSENVAQMILIAFIIFNIVLSLFLLKYFGVF